MKRNTTKRSLLASLLALAMCVTMLVGTTFAWFTDSASTSVNKIEAGKLKLELLDKNGKPLAENEPLTWVTEDEGDVLWEPNCTYDLEPFQIKNAGNLALKYKVTLKATKIDKTADGKSLLDVIDWTIKLGDNVLSVTSEQIKDGLGDGIVIITDQPLLADKADTIRVTGHMREDAGNEYQGLTIDGFGITVAAAQYTHENDSTGNQYDADAAYPVADKQDLLAALEEINSSEEDGKSSIIVVTDNFTFDDETLAFKKGDVTLDLADKELIINSAGQDGIAVENGASLTLTGGSGKLTIESGSGKGVRLTNTKDAESATEFTVKDVQLDIKNDARTKSAIYAYAENGDNNIEINVEKGAEINIDGARNFCAVQLANNAVLNYNGGVINASGVGSVVVAGQDNAGKDADDIVVNFNEGLINITGGNVIGIECNYFAQVNMNGGAIRISGGCDDSYAVGASFGGHIDLNGGTIEVNAASGSAYAIATYGNYSADRKSTVTIGSGFEIKFGDALINQLADLYPYTVLIDNRG